MLTDVLFRPASPSDIPLVAALLEQCHLPSTDLALIIEHFHLAHHAGHLIGCAAAEPHGADILIRSVAVDPAWRDHGIAMQLVDALLVRARAAEVRAAYLLSSAAPAYFARWGFSLCPLEQVPADISASPSFQRALQDSACCMCCPLSPSA